MKVCPSCSASVPDSAAVCPSCLREFDDEEGDRQSGEQQSDEGTPDLRVRSDDDPRGTLTGMPGEDADSEGPASDSSGGAASEAPDATHMGFPTVDGTAEQSDRESDGARHVDDGFVERRQGDGNVTQQNIRALVDRDDSDSQEAAVPGGSGGRAPSEQHDSEHRDEEDDGAGEGRSTEFGMPVVDAADAGDAGDEQLDAAASEAADEAGWLDGEDSEEDLFAAWGIDDDSPEHTAQGRAAEAESPSEPEVESPRQPTAGDQETSEADERYGTQMGMPQVDTGRIWRDSQPENDARSQRDGAAEQEGGEEAGASEADQAADSFEFEQEDTPTHDVDPNALEEVDRQVSQMQVDEDDELWKGPTIEQAISDSEARVDQGGPDFPADASEEPEEETPDSEPEASPAGEASEERGSNTAGSGIIRIPGRDKGGRSPGDDGDGQGGSRATSGVINLPGGRGPDDGSETGGDDAKDAKDSGVFGNSTYILGKNQGRGADPGDDSEETEKRGGREASADAEETSDGASGEPVVEQTASDEQSEGVFGDEDRGPTGFHVEESEGLELDEPLDSRPLPRADTPDGESDSAGAGLDEPTPSVDMSEDGQMPFADIEEREADGDELAEESLEAVDFGELDESGGDFGLDEASAETSGEGGDGRADPEDDRSGAGAEAGETGGDTSEDEASELAETPSDGAEAAAADPPGAEGSPGPRETERDTTDRRVGSESDDPQAGGLPVWLGVTGGLILAGYFLYVLLAGTGVEGTTPMLAVAGAGVASVAALVGSTSLSGRLRRVVCVALGALALGAVGLQAASAGLAGLEIVGLLGGALVVIAGLLSS